MPTIDSPHTEEPATPTLGLEPDQLERWKSGATRRLHSFPEALLWEQGEAGEGLVGPAHTIRNTGLDIGVRTQTQAQARDTRNTAIRMCTRIRA